MIVNQAAKRNPLADICDGIFMYAYTTMYIIYNNLI